MYSIYIIENKINKKLYIGKTKDFEKRIKRHLWDLKNNKHHSLHLQRSWNKYGEEAFTSFEALNNLTADEAKENEEYLINKYYNYLYNVSKQSSGGDLVSYHPDLESIKKKHSENGTKWWESKDEKEKNEFANKFKGENNAMYGITHTEEARIKISNANKGRKMNDEQKQKMSEFQRNRFSDPKERQKVSERNRNRYEDINERKKTSEANRIRYENPIEREKMSIIGKKRYEKDYNIHMPNGKLLKFTNLCDIIEYFKNNYLIGKWTIKELIKTGEPWNPVREKHKHLTGLKIIVNVINE